MFGRGRKQRVVALYEYLSWGPIGCSLAERVKWFETHVPCEEGWDWFIEIVNEFMGPAGEVREPVIWIAPRNAAEMSAFYWYIRQFGAGSARMIVADQPLEGAWRGEPPLSLGELNQELLAQLLDGSPEPWDSRRFPLETWDSLVRDNALLRIVEDGQLRSAPADAFDAVVLRNTPAIWTRWSRVIGNSMADLMNAGHAVDDLFLRWRLQDLVAGGQIELDGDLSVRGTGEDAAKLRRIAPI